MVRHVLDNDFRRCRVTFIALVSLWRNLPWIKGNCGIEVTNIQKKTSTVRNSEKTDVQKR